MINTAESGYGLIQEIQYAIATAFGWVDSVATKVATVVVSTEVWEKFTGTDVVEIKPWCQLHRVVREGPRRCLGTGVTLPVRRIRNRRPLSSITAAPAFRSPAMPPVTM